MNLSALGSLTFRNVDRVTWRSLVAAAAHTPADMRGSRNVTDPLTAYAEPVDLGALQSAAKAPVLPWNANCTA